MIEIIKIIVGGTGLYSSYLTIEGRSNNIEYTNKFIDEIKIIQEMEDYKNFIKSDILDLDWIKNL